MESKQAEGKSSSQSTLSVWKSFLATVISSLTFSCVCMLVKYMTNIYQVSLMGYQEWAFAAIALPQLVMRRENIFGPPGVRILLAICSISTSVAICFIFFASCYLPLGVAVVVVSCNPVFVSVGAKIFLKEAFGLLHALSLLSTILGIIFVTRVYENSVAEYTTIESIYGLLSAMAANLLSTASYLLMRRLKDVHYTVIIFTNGISGVVISVIVSLLSGGFSLHYCGQQQVFIILIGFLAYLSMLLITVAVQNMDAGPVSTIKASAGIFFAFLFQVVVFDDFPDGVRILGAVFVCLSVALMGFRKQIEPLLPKKCITFC